MAAGFHHPVEVTLFTAPPRDRLFKNHTWEKELVDNVTFPLAHGVQVQSRPLVCIPVYVPISGKQSEPADGVHPAHRCRYPIAGSLGFGVFIMLRQKLCSMIRVPLIPVYYRNGQGHYQWKDRSRHLQNHHTGRDNEGCRVLIAGFEEHRRLTCRA